MLFVVVKNNVEQHVCVCVPRHLRETQRENIEYGFSMCPLLFVVVTPERERERVS